MTHKTFKQRQYDYQYQVVLNHPEWFDNDKCGGKFRSRIGIPDGQFILQCSENNLYKEIRSNRYDEQNDVKAYFRKNGIGWWGGYAPTAHMCSSQIACVNHLFLLRKDHKAVLAIANSVCGDTPFDDVMIVGGDKYNPGYISFEVVTDKDYLNEGDENGNLSRGSNCTSIDAVILAKRGEQVVVLAIEWKFVEEYGREDKSKGDSGKVRIDRYFMRPPKLVQSSRQINFSEDRIIMGSIFFQEPYYQLMRQTLWCEQVVEKNDPLFKGASDYLHIHVVPKANETLRNRSYRNVSWDKGQGMVETWKSNLIVPDKYNCIDPRDLFTIFLKDANLRHQYKELIEYLEVRYWDAK